jgi:hypothetical protein
MSAVRFMAFADRSCSFEQDVQEISRFSCMLFLSVRGFSDYAGPDKSTRDYRGCRIAFLPYRNGVGVLIQTGFSKLNSPAHRYLYLRLQARPRDLACKTRGQDGVAVSFPVGLSHPLTTYRFIPAHSGLPVTRDEQTTLM